jgi:hypothetical protein
MVLDYKKVFGIEKKEKQGGVMSKEEDQENLKKEDRADAIKEAAAETKGDKMPDKIYKSSIDNLIEGNARHLKGEILKVKIDDARAAALINAGYIEEVVPASAIKPEVKEAEAPIKKVITADEAETKGATGKGAGLLKKKK